MKTLFNQPQTIHNIFESSVSPVSLCRPEGTVVFVPEVGRWLGADRDSFVLFIISLKNLLNLRGLQQGHTGSKLSVAMIYTEKAQIRSKW